MEPFDDGGGGAGPPLNGVEITTWPGTEEVPKQPSWAQIIGGQVSDNEVTRFENEFRLMVPGEGAVAKMTGNDYIIRENYLKDLADIVKENDEEKATMGALHFKIEEVDEEGLKVNYTEGESNEQLAIKDEVATRLVTSLSGSKWKAPIKGANILLLGDSYYVELKDRIKICKLLAKKDQYQEIETEMEGNFYG